MVRRRLGWFFNATKRPLGFLLRVRGVVVSRDDANPLLILGLVLAHEIERGLLVHHHFRVVEKSTHAYPDADTQSGGNA